MSKRIELTSRVRHELMGDGDIRNAADIMGDCLVRFDNGILVWCAEEALTIITDTDTVIVELSREDAQALERNHRDIARSCIHPWYQRVADACRKALETDPVVTVVDGVTITEWADGRELREEPDGLKVWRLNGALHRTDGPAVVNANVGESYWLNGVRISKLDWKEATR